MFCYFKTLDPLVGKMYLRSVGPWFNNNVVLHLAVAAVEFDVNTGIDLFIEDGPIGGDVGPPFLRVLTDEVVDLAFLRVCRDDFRVWVGIEEGELDDLGRNAPPTLTLPRKGGG